MRRDDDGVIAVVTALLVAAVLLPVAALGLTAYTRAGVTAEMQRAADSGALAGAASLGLLDVDTLLGAGIVDELLPIPDTFAVLGSTGRACTAARAARSATGAAPLSDAFATAVPGCTAVYTPDPAFSSCTSSISNAVVTLVGPVSTRLTSLLGTLLAPVVGPQITSMQAVVAAVDRLVPALAHNGVRVALTYPVQGPMDGLLPGASAPTASSVTADARRQFKPLLPDLSNLGTLLGVTPVAPLLNGLGTSLSSTETFTVATLQLVLNVLRYLVGEISASQLVTFLDATLGLADTLLRPLVGLLTALLSPLTGPVTLPTVSALTTPCLEAAKDLIDDLSSGLRVNTDGETDLLACLVKEVLGLPDLSTVVVTQSCVNRVFRAQLAK